MTDYKINNLRLRSKVVRAINNSYIFWNDRWTEVQDKEDKEFLEKHGFVKRKMLEKKPKPVKKDFSKYGEAEGIGERTIWKLEKSFDTEEDLIHAIETDAKMPLSQSQKEALKEFLHSDEEEEISEEEEEVEE